MALVRYTLYLAHVRYTLYLALVRYTLYWRLFATLHWRLFATLYWRLFATTCIWRLFATLYWRLFATPCFGACSLHLVLALVHYLVELHFHMTHLSHLGGTSPPPDVSVSAPFGRRSGTSLDEHPASRSDGDIWSATRHVWGCESKIQRRPTYHIYRAAADFVLSHRSAAAALCLGLAATGVNTPFAPSSKAPIIGWIPRSLEVPMAPRIGVNDQSLLLVDSHHRVKP